MAKKVAVLVVNPVNGSGLFQYLETFFENGIPFRTFAVADTTNVKTNSGLRLQTDDIIASLKGHEHEYDALVFACGDAMPKFAENADKPYNVDMLSVIKNFADQGKTIAGHCAAALLFDNLGIAQGRRVALHPFLKPVVKSCIGTDEKAVIDGNFPTVVSPNPENPEGFYLAIDLAKKNDVDFILGTDPDSDRVGIMVRNRQGEFEPVTGNQTGVLLLDYLIGAMKRAGKLPEKPAALKTIVTTEMARAVAEANGLACYDTFTGFKFMAEKMNELESAGKNTVIFSYEESYGYMIGHYVRDKDAVTASLLLTEMAAWYYAQGMTLFDALESLFKKYGFFGEKTFNLVMPGLDGTEKMASLMKSLRETPPREIAGVPVAVYKDYAGTARDAASGKVTKIALAGSNVLRFELSDGTHIVVRPSGTEPKIKVYVLTKGADAQERDANLEKYAAWVKTLA